VVTKRESCEVKTGKSTLETSFHVCTASSKTHDGAGWGGLVRSHWGIENRNHWRRDACLLEDKTPGSHAFVVGNMAVARAALLFFNAQTEARNINRFIQHNQLNPKEVFESITTKVKFK
jgi:predicted transposase YbfD/YdcC